MTQPNIVIIDYSVGNIHSVYNALKTLNYKNIKITNKKEIISDADFIILPGVGAFDKCIKNLRDLKLDNILEKEILIKKKPLMGICVGMQMLADYSDENGIHKGLGWIPGNVQKIKTKQKLPIPHVGWNNINIDKKSLLISKNLDNVNFYFDHSYNFNCDQKYITAHANYGGKITSVIQKDNIIGIQFHPEKSQNNGLRIFRNFINLI